MFQEAFLKNLNTPAAAEGSRKITTAELIVGKSYKILRCRQVNTRYGKSVVAVLEDAGDYFLPPSYSTRFLASFKDGAEYFNCTDIEMVMCGRRSDTYKSPILNFMYKGEAQQLAMSTKN